MVSLVKNKMPRRTVRRKDFSPVQHTAPQVTQRLSRAYHHEPASPWRKWLVLSLAVFVLGFITAILYAPIFTIKNVIINNVGFKPTEERLKEILNEVIATRRWHILPQSNLIFFSEMHTREILATEFYIEDVSFTRHWPNVLKLNVANNVIVAVLRVDKNEFLIDRRGVLVQQLQAEASGDSLPLVVEQDGPARSLGDEGIDPDIVLFIDELYDNWRTELPNLMPQYINIEPKSLPTIQVHMPEGWYVNITGESSANSQIESLKRLLEERIKDDRAKLQYIDVRFGNRLYFKLK